ncbi:MAG: YncE family protein [Hyphomicrobiales bacterium]
MNRIASLAILPLMALALAWAWKLQVDASVEAVTPPTEGQLVVANLRSESLTFIPLAAPGDATGLSLFGPPHEMLEAGGRLYVTLGRAGMVAAVDPGAPGVLAEYEYEQSEPHGLAYEDGRIAVTFDATGTVSLVSPANFAQLDSFRTGATPHAVALTGNELYVTDSRDNAIRLIDLTTGAAKTAPTGALPESLAVVAGVVVTGDHDGRSLSIFRRGTLEPVGTVALDGAPVRVVPLDGRSVAVALSDTGRVASVDLAKLAVTRTVAVAGRPDGICLSPSGSYAAVVSNAEDVVQVFRLSDWALAATYRTGDGPGACLWRSGTH